jgi:hypothetical protein
MVPEGLKDWLVSHVPPNVDPIWSSIGLCTVGFGDGIPTAHVPVNALTETTVTTTMIPQNYGSVIPSTTPEPVVVPPTPTPVPDIPSSAAPVVVPSQSNPAGKSSFISDFIINATTRPSDLASRKRNMVSLNPCLPVLSRCPNPAQTLDRSRPFQHPALIVGLRGTFYLLQDQDYVWCRTRSVVEVLPGKGIPG